MTDPPTESQAMFRTLMRVFLQHLPRSAWGDIRRLVTLAWAVVGLCLTRKVTFAGWGEYTDSPATRAASRARRFARWFDNAHIQVQTLYAPLVRAALTAWAPTERLALALDVSVIKGSPFVLIRISLIYRGRAIPLAWRVFCHASASVAFADYAPVLKQALACLPSGLPIVLLADRGFVHAELFQWLQRHQWHYRIRLTGDTLVHLPNRQVVPISNLRPPKGAAHFYHGIGLLGVDLRPCHLALARLDEPNQDP